MGRDARFPPESQDEESATPGWDNTMRAETTEPKAIFRRHQRLDFSTVRAPMGRGRQNLDRRGQTPAATAAPPTILGN